MARKQTLVQLTDALLAALDERASREGRSRSELIRAAVSAYLDGDREAQLDRQLVQAYTRTPPGDLVDARGAARAMIVAEPW